MTYLCAIAPLDQSTTSLGWGSGMYRRELCPASGLCGWVDHSQQFLADPGTPVVAPMPMTVVGLSPLKLRPNVEVSPSWSRTVSSLSTNSDLKVTGITPAPGLAVGTQLDRGGLVGRVASGQRGVKFEFDLLSVLDFFRELGLEPVGAAYPSPYPRGFAVTPVFGGRLLARAAGPAGSSCVSAPGLHGLGKSAALSYLGSAATPPGYVDPPSSVYGRYGTSSQTDTSVPNPHQNVSPAQAAGAAGGGLLVLAALGLGAWWLGTR